MKIFLTFSFIALFNIFVGYSQRIEQQGFSTSINLITEKPEGKPYLVRQRVKKLMSKTIPTNAPTKEYLKLFIYPNPFNESLRIINLNKEEGILEVYIYNSQGVHVFNKLNINQTYGENFTDLVLESFSPGLYYIHILFKNKSDVNFQYKSEKILKL